MNKNVLYALLTVLIVAVLGLALGRNTDLEFEMTGPDGKAVKLKVAGGEIDYAAVMTALFADTFMVGAATEWLAEYRAMLSVSDIRLADKLKKHACDSIPEAPLADRLDALERCASKPGNRNLRYLALTERGYPFHNVGVLLRVSVPEEQDWPPPGKASVCTDLYGSRLELVNPKINMSIFVNASQRIECSTIRGIGTQIHLNPVNARELFDHTLRGIDTLYAITVP